MRSGPPDIEDLKRRYFFKKTNPATGLNHVALVCHDVEKTLDFYCGKLGFPLEKVIDMDKLGYHIFLNMGGGQLIAFFHFPNAPKRAPGVANAKSLENAVTAHGSMNHIAFKVNSLQEMEEWWQRLKSKGVKVSDFVHHEHDQQMPSARNGKAEFSSFYFQDPDGVLCEICYVHTDFSYPNTPAYGTHFPVDPRIKIKMPKKMPKL